VDANDWPDGSLLTLTINGGPATYQATVQFQGTQTWASFNLNGFDLQAGDVLTVTDSGSPAIERTYTVTNFAITDIDLDLDTISGVGKPGDQVEVCINVPGGCTSRYVTPAAGTGLWTVSYYGSVDLVPGSDGWASQYDPNGSQTWANWRIPNPNIQASPDGNWVQAYDWPDGSTLTMSISGHPETYQTTVSWDENGNRTYANFNLHGFDIQAGQVLTVTDNGSPAIERTYTITNLAITEIDEDLDTISGVGEPGVEVQVCFAIPEACINRYAMPAPVTGEWMVSYSGEVNLVPGSYGQVTQPGSYNVSQTWVSWRIPNPWIQASPSDNWVQAYDWPDGSTLTLSISGHLETYQTTVYLNGNQTYANFNLNGFDIQAGQTLTVTDSGSPAIVRIYTVSNLAITNINIALDTISGVGIPGTDVQVCVNIPNGCNTRYVMPAAGTGLWTVSYSGSVDLVSGSNGWAAQPYSSENRTWINWTALGHTGDGSDPTASPSNSDGCAAGTYEEGENITLSGASPATGWQISGWIGTSNNTSTASTNTVTMPAGDHVANVNYLQIYTLTVISEHGTVTESPDHLYHLYGDVVQLTANADAGWTFSSWIGCTGSGNTCSVTMDGDKIVTATYTELPPPPTLPSNFYGEIYFSDNPPTAGQLVEAYTEGISGPAATVAIKGAAPLTYVIKITGDLPGTPAKEGGAEGDLITFKINGRVVATGVWHSGSIDSLNFHPPQALPGDPYSGDEGSAISFNGLANDLGTDATTYQWDWDNDGIYDEAGQTLSHTWTNDGTYTFGLKVTDAQGGVGTATVTVNVNDVPPTNVNVGGPYNGTAGQPVALSGSATCVSVDTCTFAWDLDGDAAYDDATGASASYTWNTIGDYVIGLQVTDDDGNMVTGAANVHITGATHNITLVPGWNLVSFNLHPTNTNIANVLSSLVGNYDLVYAWDATGAHSTSGNWMKYSPTAPPYSNSLINLDETMGFWIHVTSADTLDVVGSVPVTTNIAISNNAGGWNLVAYPSAEDGALPAALVDHGVGTDFSIVYAYHANDTADPWKLFGRTVPAWANDLTELEPGWGYWVKVTADHTWDVEYVTP
jgi:hypothetical protein